VVAAHAAAEAIKMLVAVTLPDAIVPWTLTISPTLTLKKVGAVTLPSL
jgi:hypothetical protein